MSRTCVFTIVSNNYRHFARTLMQSVAEHAPEADAWVALCDRPLGNETEEPFNVLKIEELDIPDRGEFIFRYTVLELNTAVKPFVCEALIQRGYERVIFLDPDIRLYGPLDDVLDAVSAGSITLVPHLTSPVDDGLRPDELDILRAGAYNLGFIGLQAGPDTDRFLDWWKSRLRKSCLREPERGMFVDQKWMDLAPGLFPGVRIRRDRGWNVAYWNLQERCVQRKGDAWFVDAERLVFFHFSGFKPRERVFSIHQNRFTYDNVPGDLPEMLAQYAHELEENDRDGTSKLPYGFATFDDGTALPDIVRLAYRAQEHHLTDPGAISMAGPTPALLELLNAPAAIPGVASRLVTVLGYEIYRQRWDLRTLYPDVSRDRNAYSLWFVSSAGAELGVPECFIDPVRRARDELGLGTPGGLRDAPRRMLHRYMASPRLRTVGKSLTTRRMRQRMLRSAGFATPPIPLAGTPAGAGEPAMRGSEGVNLVGYVHAESGTGEAARSTLRGLMAADVPVSVIDVRHANVSRMNAKPPVQPSGVQRYRINIFHINADQMPALHMQLGTDFFRDCYNIGFWFWELPVFPERFRDSFRLLDEVWVASSFCQDAIGAASGVPVVRIPLCVDVPRELPDGRSMFGIAEDAFLVVSVSDGMSIPYRKNPLGAIEAFVKAFPRAGDGPMLVLKVSNFDRCPPQYRAGIERYLHRDDIILVDRYLAREELMGLLAAADVYLSLHRSEGFGLPIAEAMALGIPPVATAWSSNMDFMTPRNSVPVPCELVPLAADHGPYEKGNLWAEPSIERAARALVALHSDPGTRHELGARAAEDVARNLSPEVVGERIRTRLDIISRFASH